MEPPAIGMTPGHRLAGSRQNLRTMRAQLAQEIADPECENPAIPGVAALGKEGRGAAQIRLFDKPGNLEARPFLEARPVNRLAPLEIAEAGLGRSCLDPERHQPALTRQSRRS